MVDKKCIKCGEIKELSNFHSHKKMKDGRLNKCAKCAVDDVRKWREKKGKKLDREQRYARELELGTRVITKARKVDGI